MTVSIRITGIPELYRKLDRAAATATLVPPMRRAVERVRRRLTNYPDPIPDGLWARTTTKQQRAAFFAGLRAGTIRGRRSGKLGQSWVVRVTSGGGGVTGRVGTNNPYARWVQDRERQAAFHRDRWPTAQAALEEERAAIERDFAQAIDRALSR